MCVCCVYFFSYLFIFSFWCREVFVGARYCCDGADGFAPLVRGMDIVIVVVVAVVVMVVVAI